MLEEERRARRTRKHGGGAAPAAAAAPDTLLDRGPVFAFRGSSLYKDLGTTPAANGDTAEQWTDLSANANNRVQLTAGNRPLVSAISNGTATFLAAVPDGVNDYFPTAASVAHGIGTGDYTRSTVLALPALAIGYHTIWANGDAFEPALYQKLTILSYYRGGDNTIVYPPVLDTWFSIIIVRSAGTILVYINGTLNTTIAGMGTSIANAYDTLWSDAHASSSDPGSAKIAEDALLAQTSSAVQVTALYAQQTALYGV